MHLLASKHCLGHSSPRLYRNRVTGLGGDASRLLLLGLPEHLALLVLAPLLLDAHLLLLLLLLTRLLLLFIALLIIILLLILRLLIILLPILGSGRIITSTSWSYF